ncbi:hypothetical protein ANN_19598 [Periplaneta americana]|uniref:Uncharacterized protein n=1 Tax=Periplaneta americana TaxID=6978 RepID=A0ABQ8SAJ8_PERAM|nr:hypothetical protein ANN_19598 [Periplaneta americana]
MHITESRSPVVQEILKMTRHSIETGRLSKITVGCHAKQDNNEYNQLFNETLPFCDYMVKHPELYGLFSDFSPLPKTCPVSPLYIVSCDKRLNDFLGDCSSCALTSTTTVGSLDERCLPFSLTRDPVVSNLFTSPSIVFLLGGLRTPNSLCTCVRRIAILFCVSLMNMEFIIIDGKKCTSGEVEKIIMNENIDDDDEDDASDGEGSVKDDICEQDDVVDDIIECGSDNESDFTPENDDSSDSADGVGVPEKRRKPENCWFEKMLAHGITMVGTVRRNKKEIPPEALQTKGRPANTAMFLFDCNTNQQLISFSPKKESILSENNSLPVSSLKEQKSSETGPRQGRCKLCKKSDKKFAV